MLDKVRAYFKLFREVETGGTKGGRTYLARDCAGFPLESMSQASLCCSLRLMLTCSKMLIITDPFSQTQRSWLHSILPPRWRSSRDAEYGSSDTRALEPPSDNDRYHDDTEAGAESLAGAVPTASIPDSRNPSMSPTLASRVQPSGLGAASRNEEGWGHGDG